MGNAGPGLIVERGENETNNYRISPKEFCRCLSAKPKALPYYVRQLSKLAVARTYSLSSIALSNILQPLCYISEILTSQATRSLLNKMPDFWLCPLEPRMYQSNS